MSSSPRLSIVALSLLATSCSSRAAPRDAAAEGPVASPETGAPSAPRGPSADASPQTTAPPASAAPSPGPAPLAEARPAPVEAEARTISLEVPGFAPAVVVVPHGSTGARAVLVAAHGNYDRPEWQCEVWGAIVGDRGFVLCPRGTPRSDSPRGESQRFEYANNQTLEREVEAGLSSLAARFGDRVDRASPVWAGFSLGAIMGAAIARRAPGAFPRLALVEGGFSGWTAAAAKAQAKAGTSRVLFACGQAGCASSSKSVAALLEKEGIAARVVQSLGEGHSYGGKVAAEIASSFDWLVEGDARWRRDR